MCVFVFKDGSEVMSNISNQNALSYHW